MRTDSRKFIMKGMIRLSVYKETLRAIVMAQAASDFGKGRYPNPSHKLRPRRWKGAQKMAYAIKVQEIVRALKMIDTNPRMGINYYVTIDKDQNGKKSIVTFFDIKLSNDRMQISFHTPIINPESKQLSKWVGKGRKTRWSARHGGSRSCAERLTELFCL
jgi:hypothetical protein